MHGVVHHSLQTTPQSTSHPILLYTNQTITHGVPMSPLQRRQYIMGNSIMVLPTLYPLGIPPNLRTNIDYVFILREPYLTNRKRIWENYASMFPTLESFCAVMDQCTENFECLVINNNAKSNKLNDQIFWYKAENHPNFKLGSKEFWEITKSMGSDDEDESYDPSKSKKKNTPTINVKKSKW